MQQTAPHQGQLYHHFDGIDAFKKALLTKWEESHTMEPIRASIRESGQRRRQALRKAVSTLDLDLERAIRAWATIDPIARHACSRIDAQRVRYLAECFPDVSPAAAAKLARADYALLIGRLFVFDTHAGTHKRPEA